MRVVGLVPAVLSLIIGAAAHAQAWDVYVNRENFFSLNLPGAPKETTEPYRTAKGTTLTARKFTATAPAGSLLAGTYSLTVVDYSKATGELGTAIDEAAERFRRMGKVTYDAVNMLDNHRSWRQTVETANERILTEILVGRNNRLYISEAMTAINAPPPAQFQASLQILDDNGVRIRYTQSELVQTARPDEVVPVTPQQVALRSAELAGSITGTWRTATGGSCEAAYFRSGERLKTSRGEEAMRGTVVNAGLTITGQLIIAGPREGQFINPMTDKAIFLFDTLPGSQMSFAAIGEPVLGWPDVTLERCPAGRG
jgi:hypothetical protein